MKDILAYLKFIYNPQDVESLNRIINVPKRSIFPIIYNKITEEHKKSKDIDYLKTLNSIADGTRPVPVSPTSKTALTSFVNMCYEAQQMMVLSVSKIKEILQKVG